MAATTAEKRKKEKEQKDMKQMKARRNRWPCLLLACLTMVTSGVEILTRMQDHNIDEFVLSKCNTLTSTHIYIFVSKTTYSQILTHQAVII